MNSCATFVVSFTIGALLFLILTSDYFLFFFSRRRKTKEANELRKKILEHPENYKGRCVYLPNAHFCPRVQINEYCWQPTFRAYEETFGKKPVETIKELGECMCPCTKCSPYMMENKGFEVLKDGEYEWILK